MRHRERRKSTIIQKKEEMRHRERRKSTIIQKKKKKKKNTGIENIVLPYTCSITRSSFLIVYIRLFIVSASLSCI